MVRILVADEAGACYGVERALELAWSAVDSGENVHTLGPLIHNPRVVSSLEAMGAQVVDDVADASGGTLILRTHGVTPAEEERAKRVCSRVIDATCPFVKKVHVSVERLSRDGYQVAIVGEAGHPEVVATLGHAPEALVISNAAEAASAQLGPKVGVVVQTTQTKALLDSIMGIIDDGTRDVRLVNTICEATSLRQAAAADLAQRSDAMVVIGGRNSANTTHLAEICLNHCTRTHHIEDSSELEAAWFRGCETIGITAGASTPAAQLSAVRQALERLVG